jgi:hypothetical protein
MGNNGRSVPHLHGNGEVAVSRYFALYLAQAGWLTLGLYLFSRAYWPSTCRPDTFLEIYSCSMRLAESRGWVESMLMTWLWSTPILITLELMRHYDRFQQRRRR